jgi:hypothetical protein
MSQHKFLCTVLLTLGAAGAQTSAANYQFVNIVDSAGPLDPVTTATLNNSGTVAFHANRDAGGGGLFTGNGGPTTTITSLSVGGRINNQGAVVFGDGNGHAIFVGGGGPITTIADTSGPISGNLGVTSINDSGTVGFFGRLDDVVGEGIFTGSGGPTTTVALSGPQQSFALVQDVQVNNTGTVAFVAVLHELGDSVSAILIGNPGSPMTVADSYGPFHSFEPAMGLNNNGEVAFEADLDGGGSGIFTGPDPVADKVIQIGDFLFGSSVSNLIFCKHGLNDEGDIVFFYELANGISGIALARPFAGDFNSDGTVDAADYVVWRKSDGTPAGYDLWRAHFGEPVGNGAGAAAESAAVPEPATLVLLMCAAAGWCLRRRRAA